MRDDTPQVQAQPEESFSEAVLGKELFQSPLVKRLTSLPATVWFAGLMAVFAGLLFIPYLGAVGLWDPWETHYGEVARSMIERNDYVVPYWESAWFFSKPVFTMWLMALGMQVAGTNRTEGAVALLTEWGMRMPFALLSLLAVVLLSLAVSRTVNRRAGLATGFVLGTMPLYLLVARQAMTDTPFVTTMICALSCAIIGQLDPSTRHRSGWWYAFYVFVGFSTLAKGLLGGIPVVVLLVYALLSVLPYDEESVQAHLRWLTDGSFRARVRDGQAPMPTLWGQFFRMRFGTGILVFLAVALPWYLKMSLFPGVDDESKDFFTRFFIHDHFNRLGAGVHTTTPGGAFTYFIEQGGYAIFPWVALVPGALALLTRLRVRGGTSADHVGVIAFVWFVLTFGLLGMSATKFHHYVFPMLPGLAVLIALFIDRLWTEGIPRHALTLILGGVLFALVGKDLAGNPKNITDLFVYNYDRAYPFELVTRPLSLFTSRTLWTGDLVAVVLVALGGYLAYDAFTAKGRPVFSRALSLLLAASGGALLVVMATRGTQSPTLFLGLAVLLAATYLGFEAARASAEERGAVIGALAVLVLVGAGLVVRGVRAAPGADSLLAPLVQPVNLKMLMGFAFITAGSLCALGLILRARVMTFGTFWVFALGFAVWLGWNHWVDLSHHWTQRDLFWRYYKEAKPDEPIVALEMNWRGETFYSRNRVKQIKERHKFPAYAALPGTKWVLIEHMRGRERGVDVVRNLSQGRTVTAMSTYEMNNKFVLVKIE